MTPSESLMHRLAFAGLPLGEVQRIFARAESGMRWTRACFVSARAFRRLARAADAEGRTASATEGWLWTAVAYQAASFGPHFGDASLPAVARARRLARAAYRRAIAADPAVATAVAIPFGEGAIHGYLRVPGGTMGPMGPVGPMKTPASGGEMAAPPQHSSHRSYGSDRSPVVVLLNGLDSICEVEMHAFASWLLSRGIATLALDFPADAASPTRHPRFTVEDAAAAIRDFVASDDRLDADRRGVFGVSFGGHLAARLLAADGFRCGVAVSPPAWLADEALALPRIRAMFAWSFAAAEEEIDTLSSRIRITSLEPPRGPLLVFHMNGDRLFDERHLDAFTAWGGDAVIPRRLDAEHVGTSQYHQWLPFACDWLRRELA